MDKEQQHASVQITFNHIRQKVNTAAGFVAYMKDGLFQVALNNRLFKMGRKPDPPFWLAQVRFATHTHADSGAESKYTCKIEHMGLHPSPAMWYNVSAMVVHHLRKAGFSRCQCKCNMM